MENLEDFLETHYEIVSFIESHLHWTAGDEEIKTVITDTDFCYGQGGLYELAKNWTEIFQEKYKNEIWGETADYHDTLKNFLEQKNQL